MAIFSSVKEAIERLKRTEAKASEGGGAKRLEEQVQKGKMTARDRIHGLLDEGSFVELHMLAETQCHDFDMHKKKILGDGVVTGYGKVEGRTVFIFAQDATVFGGSAGRAHGQKICYILRKARETGAPVIGLYDSAGGRIQEGVDNVAGYGELFYENVQTSGVVPQISAIMGACTGGAVYSPALTDFILMVKGTSQMFITGPAVIEGVTGEKVTFEDLGGSRIHSARSGVVHFIAENDRDCLKKIRDLLSFLPANNRERPPLVETGDDFERSVERLEELVPIDPKKSYDIKKVIREIVDQGNFLEVQSRFAMNMVIGFGRFAGRSVGIVANQSTHFAGAIDLNAADKASRFIRFCDAFNLPIVTLMDVPGYMPGVAQEHGGIIRHGAKMLYAYAESTVAKITIVLRKGYGGSITAMCCKELGADLFYAWPFAELAVMGSGPAVKIIYRKEIDGAGNREAVLQEKIKEYEETFYHPYFAASKQLIDAVIEPKETRRKITSGLLLLENKIREGRPWKRHGLIPS